MKWIIALVVSALMFFIGYRHAERYVEVEAPPTTEPAPADAIPVTPTYPPADPVVPEPEEANTN